MSKPSKSFNVHALLYGLVGLVVLTGGLRAMLTGTLGPGKKTHLAFWNGFTGPDGVVMLNIIEEFNKANPDVEVSMQRIPWATYYNKLTVAGSDGRGPEIFICHADALPRIRRTGMVADVNDLYEGADAIPKTDFEPFVMDRVEFGPHLSGVPLDIHAQGMYCDAEMFKKAGIVNPDGSARPPETKEEFLDAIKKMTIEAGPNQPEKQWGFAFTYWGNNFRSLMPQFDGRYMDEKGNADMNCEGNLRALEFLAKVSKEGLAPPPDNQQGWVGFRQKRVAMVWDGVYMLGDLLRLDNMEYLGAPIPTIGDHPGTLANSHIMCLKATLNPTQREAAERFVRYVSKHSLEWAAAGQIPARLSVRNNPAFAKMQVQSAFAKQIPWIKYPPKTPAIFDFQLEIDREVEYVVRGQKTAKQALDECQKNCQDIVDRDRKEHPEEAGENG